MYIDKNKDLSHDFKMLSSINDVPKIVSGIKIEDVELFLEEVNTSLYWLKRNSKKIGNAQRGYFAYFYRDLMNKEGDTYQDPYASSKSALRKYQAQNM